MEQSQPIPSPSLVVLIGPPASGKSTWASSNFSDDQILSADTLRGVVGEHELDLAASNDAFLVLDQILAMRLGRKLTTVIDTTGLDDARRASYLAVARDHGVGAVAVRFTTSAAECKRRNRERSHPVPVKALDTLVKRFRVVSTLLENESWDIVLDPQPVRVVTAKLQTEARTPAEQRADAPAAQQPLRFGLLVSDFSWIADKANIGGELAVTAQQAEDAGFDGLWLMDHLIQIPQVGREWDPMLDPYSTLGYLAAATERIRLGVLVSPVTMRHVGLLAKAVATLDVLSGGRAVAGIGAGSSKAEHEAFGIRFGSPGERLALLEEALQALPLIWGSGSKPFRGDSITIDRALGYPRPLQDPMPLIVGGSGEKRTLELAARYGTGCNLFGDLAAIERRLNVVRHHLESFERDATTFEFTHLGNAVLASDPARLRRIVDELRPSNMGPERFADRSNAGTLDDHEAIYRQMSSLGINTAIISTPRLSDPTTLDTWANLISRFL